MRGLKQKPQHGLHIVRVSRTRDDNVRHFVLTQAIGRRVAHCAVVRDALKPHHFFRKTDRNFMSFFPDNTERFVPARSGHEIGKDAW